MPNSPAPRGFEIAPFRGLRYSLPRLAELGAGGFEEVTSPPYDVLSPADHERLLAASPYNITRLTLGLAPGAASSYEERGSLLRQWEAEGVLVRESDPSFYVYTVEYSTPGGERKGEVARFQGLLALGRLHPFSDGVVLPHEQTFSKVVDDRLRLLEATRTHLESIFLLYSDPKRRVDAILEAAQANPPAMRVQAKPGEVHALHPITDIAQCVQLMDLLSAQRPIIADGHHRYTMGLRYWTESKATGQPVPGASWQMMTLANLYGNGLSILATHRLVKLKDRRRPSLVRSSPLVPGVVASLLEKLEPSSDAECDFWVATRERQVAVRVPDAVRAGRAGVAGTAYGMLQDIVLGDWLGSHIDEGAVRYFKEGTGEYEALRGGAGDILFRMKPVVPEEFQRVVQGGEVYPHKTTYFYPKLWSGLVLWPISEPSRLALK